MSSATLRLILIISCAHALVHIFELSLPSVEQLIGDEFSGSRQMMGWMGTVWYARAASPPRTQRRSRTPT